MGCFRISIELDVEAADRGQATDRLLLLCDELEASNRHWIIKVLPNGAEEQMEISEAA